jgi:hypothetical protein
VHYLERVWGGEANYEDHWNREPPPGTRDEQASVVQMLLSTLRREPRETTIMLSVTYGLGTASPSPFALELVKRAELTSSCQALLTSSERIKRLPPEVFRAPVLNFSKRLIRSSAELRIIRDRIRMLLCSAGKEHHTFVFEQFTIKRNYETIASFPSNYLNLTYG